MDDWVQVLLGKKYSPNQPRDESGRFGSGGGGGIDHSPKLKAALSSRENAIAGLKTERAQAYDEDGNTVLAKGGSKHSVGFTQAELDQMKGSTFTHNHPGDTSFSQEDVDVAIICNLKEMRAVGVHPITGERLVYSISPKEKGWPSRAALRASYLVQDATQKKEFWPKVRSGALSPKEASANHGHEVWKRIAKDLDLNYSQGILE